jgi:hypothetical protein
MSDASLAKEADLLIDSLSLKTADEIAVLIKKSRVRGRRMIAGDCPLVNFLRKKLNLPEDYDIVAFDNLYISKDHRQEILLKRKIQDTSLSIFIMRFDQGEFPELNRSAPRSKS